MIPVTINNTTLWYDRLIYVDATVGDDTLGDGSETNPFKSVGRAIDAVNSVNTAIIVRPGVYNESLKSIGSANALFINNEFGYDVIGEGDNTVINLMFDKAYCYVVCLSSIKSIKLYNLVININVVFDTSFSYHNCILYDWTDYSTFVANNCVFKFIGFDYTRGIVRRVSNNSNLVFNNCVFILGGGRKSYTGYRSNSKVSGVAYFYNCVFHNLKNWKSISGTSDYDPVVTLNRCIESDCGTSYFNITRNQPIVQSVIFDDRYYITNTDVWIDNGWGLNPSGTPASIGVYGGPFAWGGGGNVDIQIPAPNVTISGGMDYNFQFSIKVPSGGSNSIVIQNMDQEGTLGSGTLYSKTINKNSFNKILRVEVK